MMNGLGHKSRQTKTETKGRRRHRIPLPLSRMQHGGRRTVTHCATCGRWVGSSRCCIIICHHQAVDRYLLRLLDNLLAHGAAHSFVTGTEN